MNLFKYASPATFYPLAGKMIPGFAIAAVLFAIVGLYVSFFVAPTDYQQSEAYRIMFIHVPAAWMSMWIYLIMACYAAAGLIWNTRLSAMMAISLAPTGAIFTVIALWTGSLWGKPMWGTWWIWDARLTSYLLLLFLYIGFIALHNSISDSRRAAKATGLLAIVGVVNLPIIYFSVQWWNTLHQGSSFSFGEDGTVEASMATSMVWGLLLMTFAFWMYSIAVTLIRVRSEILEREKESDWVEKMLSGQSQ